MNVPKEISTYCPKCKTHTSHTVSLYKEGKRRALALGERRHKRERSGYGGQKYPMLKRKAKTTKKQAFKYRCKKCGFTIQRKGIRLRKVTIQ
jgi:large subunit ribosomal protein L44e